MRIQVLRLPSDELNELPQTLNDELTLDALALALQRTLETTGFQQHLSERGIDPWVSLWLMDDAGVRSLNRSQRDLDEVTDVLSFPSSDLTQAQWPEQPEEVLQTEPPLFIPQDSSDPTPYSWEVGTLAIALPRASEQAERYGHHTLRELTFLAVHGMLHLLGYDHTNDNSELMESLQDVILNDLGITRDLRDEDLPGLKLAEQRQAATIEIDDEILASHEWDEILWDFDSLGLSLVDDLEVTPPTEALPEGFVSGFVSLLGRTNAGKSTLLNALTGMKVAITSHKSQTTRNNIRAIVNQEDAQIIFTDTPGIFEAKNKLGSYMRDAAMRALQDADLALLLVDAEKAYITEIERTVCELATKTNKPLILVLTKIDLIPKEDLLPSIARYSELHPFEAIIPISSLKNDGLDQLLAEVKRLLPEGPRFYPETASTDQTERSLASELIREQLLYYLHQEIPHGVAVQIEEFAELNEDDEPVSNPDERTLVRITASIVCEREAHKRIVIGEKGQSLKRIGSSARRNIEQMLGTRVYLDLHVKVREDWRNRSGLLKDLGYSGADGDIQ